jgi:hypothetical protein
MRKTARLKEPRAVKQLLDIKARATKQTQDTLEYLEWLLTKSLTMTDDRHDQRPRNRPTAAER